MRATKTNRAIKIKRNLLTSNLFILKVAFLLRQYGVPYKDFLFDKKFPPLNLK